MAFHHFRHAKITGLS